MLSCIKQSALAIALCLPLLNVSAAESPVKIIEPKKTAKPKKSAIIDTEKIQAGIFLGMLSVEDFNSNFASGLSVNYLLNDDYLLQLNYGRSTVDRSTFEKREGIIFLAPNERDFTYLNLLGGYKLFTSRSFLGAKRKYDSDLYLLAGLGNVDFAGESNVSLVLGTSYRIVFTDWLVASIDFKDHIFSGRNVFAPEQTKMTQNLELGFGFNALF